MQAEVTPTATLDLADRPKAPAPKEAAPKNPAAPSASPQEHPVKVTQVGNYTISQTPQPSALQSGVFEFKEILLYGIFGGVLNFLIDWAGYAPNDRSWVPHMGIPLDCQEKFWRDHPQFPKPQHEIIKVKEHGVSLERKHWPGPDFQLPNPTPISLDVLREGDDWIRKFVDIVAVYLQEPAPIDGRTGSEASDTDSSDGLDTDSGAETFGKSKAKSKKSKSKAKAAKAKVDKAKVDKAKVDEDKVGQGNLGKGCSTNADKLHRSRGTAYGPDGKIGKYLSLHSLDTDKVVVACLFVDCHVYEIPYPAARSMISKPLCDYFVSICHIGAAESIY